jgi:hypothetical protein
LLMELFRGLWGLWGFYRGLWGFYSPQLSFIEDYEDFPASHVWLRGYFVYWCVLDDAYFQAHFTWFDLQMFGSLVQVGGLEI